ncbi:hypothetical protein BB561_004439 [Smittium simulii]|uniref:Uncharacterized protein n=1 Tax=Smittium simulii TaxID=133385 RepID=A0A2T9YG86_9FUNG|nr:hypothetical protein BB561_004439 [Smittium simulii]
MSFFGFGQVNNRSKLPGIKFKQFLQADKTSGATNGTLEQGSESDTQTQLEQDFKGLDKDTGSKNEKKTGKEAEKIEQEKEVIQMQKQLLQQNISDADSSLEYKNKHSKEQSSENESNVKEKYAKLGPKGRAELGPTSRSNTAALVEQRSASVFAARVAGGAAGARRV